MKLSKRLILTSAVAFRGLFLARKIVRDRRRFEWMGKRVVVTGGSRGLGFLPGINFTLFPFGFLARPRDSLHKQQFDMNHSVRLKIRHCVAKVIHSLRAREPLVLVGLLLLVAGTWGFIALADEVSEGSTADFDHWAIRQLRTANDVSIPIGAKWMAEVGRDITGLGGIAVLTLFIISAAGFLAIYREYRTMVVLVASSSSGIIVSLLLKNAFARPRPDLVPHLTDVYTSSFPSGHSMMSAVVYLTLAAILAPVLKHFWLRVYVLTCAVVLTVLIGLSRIYMGVHYPTDVLAGWTAGLVWAIACWLLARSSSNRKV